MSVKIKRSVYADMFGPTTGDRVRLADTDLIIEVEKDFTVYGGGGLVMGALDDEKTRRKAHERLEAFQAGQLPLGKAKKPKKDKKK